MSKFESVMDSVLITAATVCISALAVVLVCAAYKAVGIMFFGVSV